MIDIASAGDGDGESAPDIFGEESQRNKEVQLIEKFHLEEFRETFIAAGGLAVGTEGLLVRYITLYSLIDIPNHYYLDRLRRCKSFSFI